MRKKGIKFHARSIFLQGILLKDKKSLPKYFLKWIMLFDKWEDWHKKNRQKKIVSCINFVSKIKFIDKIIVGINNLEQLKQIIKIKESKYPINIYSKDQKLLKPYLWKLRKYEK